MTKYVYEINQEPTPWGAHKGYGAKSYSKHTRAKHYAQMQIRCQNRSRCLIKGAVRVDYFFEVACPKTMSKKLLKRIQAGEKVYCTKRPDRDNYIKFASDVLSGTVFQDDNLIVAGEAQKYYARGKPKTVIFVQEIEDAIKEG